MRLFLYLSGLLLFSANCFALKVPESVGIDWLNASYQTDDGKDLSIISDLDWKPRATHRIPANLTNIWLRFDFNLIDANSNGLFISALATHEVYWDGQRIGQSGQIGYSKKQEVPGNIDSYHRIPDSLLSAGKHQLIVRVSRQHFPFVENDSFIDVVIAPYAKIRQDHLVEAFIPFFSLGAMLVVAAFFFNLGFSHKQSYAQAERNNYHAFATLCLTVAGLLIAESWRPLWGYPYDFHIWRLACVTLLTFAVGTLFSWVIWSEFNNTYKKPLLILTLFLNFAYVFLIPNLDLSAFLMILTALIYTFAEVIRVYIQQRQKEFYLGTSVLLCLTLAVIFPRFLESWFFLMFGSVMAALLHRIAKSMRQLSEKANEQALNNERLKLELIKSHIQPHFLMNTLTCLSEWIEESPDIAQELIDALADEFRLLTKIVDRKTIEIEDEIKLCQLHVKVMSLRQDKHFDLQVENHAGSFMIPPGILHTLIENAVSHTHTLKRDIISFVLKLNNQENTIDIQLLAPFNNQQTGKRIGLGTGRKYIESRLFDVFGTEYFFSESKHASQWISELRFPKSSQRDNT